jgi:hypothetical protein
MSPEERCKLYDAALAEAAGWLPRFRAVTGTLSVPISKTVWDTRRGLRVNVTPSAMPYLCFRCGLEISGGDICGIPNSFARFPDETHVGYTATLPAARALLRALVELVPGARYAERPYKGEAASENENLRARKPWRKLQRRHDCLPRHQEANRWLLEWRAREAWTPPEGFDKGRRIGDATLRAVKTGDGKKGAPAAPLLTFHVGERHETVPALPIRGVGELRLSATSRYVARRYAIDAGGAAWMGIRDSPLEPVSTEALLARAASEEERVKIRLLLSGEETAAP